MIEAETMKIKMLKLTGTFTATLLLALLTACGPASPPVETQAPATKAAPAAAAAPAAPPEVLQPVPAPAVAPASAPAAAPPAGAMRYDALPTGSTTKVEGSSTIHDWSMVSSIVSGSIECDAKFPESALTDASAAKPVVQVTVPVRSLKSGNKKMDSVMQENMREPEFKKIEYRLIELKPKSAAGATGSLKFDAIGALTIVGATVTNTMPVTIEKTDGKLKITGSIPIKFTEYKMKPPEIKLLGMAALSVGNDLKISFEWALAPKAP